VALVFVGDARPLRRPAAGAPARAELPVSSLLRPISVAAWLRANRISPRSPLLCVLCV